ncbi:alkaline phosphatase D family protein [Azomonas macrocytogenes]|uniref:Alkaline phosphatase D n=1 Tax=Azomonas macrocytogenes TaxID=69962 RepID=A0A839SY69_AZOMA|nr:alkaline phosphatase D family protein [Azomonas macrocytogenes]MBB3102062.1 alkaline phosphatase D [Azomonas macrocytogenes]
MNQPDKNRRRFIQGLGAGLALPALGSAPAVIAAPNARPKVTGGVQAGDVLGDRAVVWSRCDRPARMVVDWDTSSVFGNPRRQVSPATHVGIDFTARIDLKELPPDQAIFYRVRFEDARDGSLSKPWFGHFRSAPQQPRDIRFVWGGDTCGQGFGINPDIGGMRIYDAMRRRLPDFFLHSGDVIYADGVIPESQVTEDGRVWRNLVTEAKSKVAETLDEFRGNYHYNLLDDNVRAFNAEVPQIWQWDDHEVTNNWSPGKELDDRYRIKDINLLVRRARQAYLENAPMRMNGRDELGRVYRKIAYGPLLDVFVLDMRSYRGANSANLQPQEGPETAFLGRLQLDWLKRELQASKARWKIIAADMPIGLHVPDGKNAQGQVRWEAIANGNNGPALGRELEIAELLNSLQRSGVRNTVWLTADVHYCAAHYYHPNRAAFQNFDPFWEFVAGPLNAGSFGPNPLDNTFGPELVFQKAPPTANSSPFAGYQFFGEVEIEAQSGALRVSLRDIDGVPVFEKQLEPQLG